MKRWIDLMPRWLPVAVAYAVATTLLYWFGFLLDNGPLYVLLIFPASTVYLFLLLCFDLLFLVSGVPDAPAWSSINFLTAALLIGGLIQGLICCLAALGLDGFEPLYPCERGPVHVPTCRK